MSRKESPVVVFKESPFKKTVINGTGYECPNWEQMGDLNRELSYRINLSGKKFNCIVPLANGGLTWARDMANRIGTSNIIPMRVRSYTGVNLNEEIELIYDLPLSVEGKKVLFFDDVFDSGQSADWAKKHLLKDGAKDVKLAALCSKPRSIIKPDFCGFVTDSWVVFPHEHREFIELSSKEWSNQGIPQIEMRTYFEDIGLPICDINEFMPRI